MDDSFERPSHADINVEILPQPTDTTCGPTCLHAIYRYYQDTLPLEHVIRDTPQLSEGGTLAALLGRHALDRGYDARIYTYNLQLFDPTWFPGTSESLSAKLKAQAEVKKSPKLYVATRSYIDFLEHGGDVRMEDLTTQLLRRYLNRSIPMLVGLSSTFLYRASREYGPNCDWDDIRGHPTGHFVILYGYSKKDREVMIADPLLPNPLSVDHHYRTGLDRVLCAILLGVLTYDANLLIIQPRRTHKGSRSARTDRHE